MNLYKIMLVDDEEEVRKSIINKIDWADAGFEVIGDAENGKDLLNRIQKMKLLRKFTLDRETEKRIRFKGTDCWGNISYLEIIR